MKIKILLAPSLIVIIIVLLIWWIYPGYTNGLDGISELQTQLTAEQAKLKTIDEKSQNVEALSRELTANSQNKELVTTFLPEASKEEEIFDNLNYFGKNGSLSVIEINTKKVQSSLPAVVPGSVTMAQAGQELKGQGAEITEASIPTAFEISEIETTAILFGNYENTKKFLGQLYALKRFNKVISLDVSVPQDNEVQTKQPTDTLQTQLTVRFDFLKKMSQVRDADIAVTDKQFNMDPVKKIIDRMNVDVMKLDESSLAGAGRGNPFLK